MTSSGVYVKSLGDGFKKSFTDHLKYNLHEADTFKDLFAYRDGLFQSYIRQEKALLEKKKALFRLRDPTKWGGFKDQPEMLRLKDELLKDRDCAFDYMLPKETVELETKRQELCFYSNQCWDEIRRVSKDNGLLLTEHFKDMGLLHCSQISSVSMRFIDFVERTILGGVPDVLPGREREGKGNREEAADRSGSWWAAVGRRLGCAAGQ